MGQPEHRRHDLKREDHRLIGRDSPPWDLQVASAEGSLIHDVRGHTYVDFVMGWCVGNLGWAQPEIRARLRAFDGPDYVAPNFLYAPWVEVARLLEELTPGRLSRSFRAVGGTEAVELALQIARIATGRDKGLAIADDYHGNSIALREIPRTLHPPLDDRALGRLERVLAHRKTAAFVMEPIICNLGVEIPTPGFMRGAAELCERYGTLFVLDEVATGFGRTGAMFASEHYGVVPDILCVAKAITGGYAPMAATITTPAIADRVTGELEFYSTYAWHPLACEAAIANLRFLKVHRTQLLANVAARSGQFADRIAAMPLPEGTQVRIKGLAIGIVLPDDDAEKLADDCYAAGLLITGEGDTAMMFPALTIDEATANRGLDLFADCVARL